MSVRLAAFALVLLGAAAGPAAGSDVGPIDALGAELGASAAQAAAEVVDGLAGPITVAVTVRAGKDAGPRAAASARLIGELVAARLAAPGRQVVVLAAADAAAASLRKAGYRLWIDVALDVDAPAGTLVAEVRARRLGVSWRELLARPAPRWLRARSSRHGLDDGLRRALGLVPRRLDRPRRFELDLGAPVLALATADLDGNGRAELIALTSDEVVVLEARKTALVARQRVALPGDAPVPRPRDPVGALLAADLDHDGVPELLARSSEHAEGVRLAWKAGALAVAGSFADYPVCLQADGSVAALALVPGQSRFAGKGGFPERLVAAACAGKHLGFVEAGGAFTLRHPERKPDLGLAGVGAAFALVDLDGDGAPELAASAYRAPGAGDQLTVQGLVERGKPELRWKSDTLSGGIVAVTGGDTDGDGAPDVIFAVRLVGSPRTDVWIIR